MNVNVIIGHRPIMMRRALLWIGFALVAAVQIRADGPQGQAPPPPPPVQQQPPPPPPQQQQPTFRVRVDSVSLDVIVTDRKGAPVSDLTADDFEIREDGKLQTIDAFKFIAIDGNDPGNLPQREILSLSEQSRAAADETNRLFVIFMDDYHVRRGNGLRVREQLAEFVSRLTPRDLVAVMYPLTPVTGLTFSRHHDGTAQALMNFEGRKYDYTPRNAFEERYQQYPPELQERMRNETVMATLESLCAYLSTLRDGRKTILYVSEGLIGTLPPGVNTQGTIGRALPPQLPTSDTQMFFNQSDLLSRMRHVFNAASRANASIYTLDPRGLASTEFDIADTVNPDLNRRLFTESTDMLRTLADQTDGRAIVARNDAVPALQQMVRDVSAYYLLGYTSTVAPRDGKFHPVDVRVKRRDVEVRARKGYWAYTAEEVERASAPPKPGPPAEISDALATLAAAIEPAGRRPFVVWMGAARGEAEKSAVTLAWEAPGGSGEDAVDRLAISVTHAQGETVFTGTAAKEAQAPSPAGQARFEAPPGLLRIRVTAENASGRRLDTDEMTFEVPDFTGTGAMISTPVVFRGRTARAIQLVRAAATPQPSASRQFSRTERLLLRFGAYGPSGVPPKVTLRLLNQLGESMAALPAPTQSQTGLFESEIGLGGLPPGDYLIEIVADAGGETARSLLGIRITG
jgi:VWFA-related protein